ncbi:hypothetical protein CCM_06589 [Cordyceps militaris CM01]|uniref:Acetylserotonin methytransferase-like protein n=1 Tax=Cordyceps militaris (strain CM01) TaxID=983644 RepID=G3JMY8_CORMM|nr:uncharacterized protein CCM_06589 [Cordyceps militaris CM01]EGX90170.1 hypothetical protein CCM_06589 [Cordyceps militaris CM01]
MAAQQPGAGGAHSNGFSLFPNPNISRPPPPPVIRLHPNPRPKRSASSRERAARHDDDHSQQQHQSRLYTPPDQCSDSDSPPPPSSPPQQQQPDMSPQQRAPLQFDPVVAETPGRRSSIAKPPLDDGSGGGPSGSSSSRRGPPPAPLRSIFPTYNPELPLDQQAYGPTQMSPSHIPRAVISRQSYYDPDAMSTTTIGQAYTTEPVPPLPVQQSPPPPQQQQDNMAAFSAVPRGPTRPNNTRSSPPVIPKTSTTEQLKTFWKAANGWKAAPSEGRVFCLALSQRRDAPVYTLSSASQPLYTLRLDPTSASALVTLSRHDPGKTHKAGKKPERRSSSAASSPDTAPEPASSSSKHWQQVLRTTLEEEARRHAPGDGLVALLMPDPATKMAVERAGEPALVAMAERECARLVWDDDSARHYLVHPALAAPFCVTVDRCPAWSRVAYTLEHHESPRPLAKLTRDGGAGAGWLEVDTAVAAHIEAYYVIDVAVAALLLVAAADERTAAAPPRETFEPPPVVPPAAAAVRSESRGSGRFSRLSSSRNDDAGRKKNKNKRRPVEEFEMDLESQDGSLAKSSGRLRRARSKRRSRAEEKEDKLPFLLRAGIKVAKGMFKCIIWVLTAVFRMLFSCVRSKY